MRPEILKRVFLYAVIKIKSHQNGEYGEFGSAQLTQMAENLVHQAIEQGMRETQKTQDSLTIQYLMDLIDRLLSD